MILSIYFSFIMSNGSNLQVPLESDGRGLQIIKYTRNADSFDGFLVENYIFSHVIIVSKKNTNLLRS